jgi:gliding motility-associated-like protein
MKKCFCILASLLVICGCTKSTIKKYGCSDPPLTGDICLPNIFTPNGDGVNDILLVRQSTGLPQIDTLTFMIKDASGTILFYSNDPAVGWDGSYNGKKKAGVYTCEVNARLTNDETIEFTGTVTMLPDLLNDYRVNDCSECRFGSQFSGHGDFDTDLPTNEPSDICN